MKRAKLLIIPAIFILSIFGVLKIFSFKANGAELAGSLDTTFPNVTTTTDYDITSIKKLSNGQYIIGGFFDYYNGKNVHAVGRINQDGSLDETFKDGLPSGFYAQNILIQQDGKILVGGRTGYINPPGNIYRLNSDGSSDTSFVAPELGRTGTGDTSFALQSSKKIIISYSLSSITRLNTDGSQDNTFNTSDVGMYISKIITLPDDSIIVAGMPFTDGTGYQDGLIKMDKDGNIEDSFLNGKIGLGGMFKKISDVQVDSQGNIWIGGDFTQYHGVSMQNIAKLYSDGTLDTSFVPFLTSDSYEVSQFIIQPDGRIVAGGYFYGATDADYRMFVRFNSDGSKDTTFDSGYGGTDSDYVCTLELLDGNKLMIGGYFSSYNGIDKANLVLINLGEYLDIVSPTGGIDINSGASSSTTSTVTLSLTATDNQLGVSQMMVCSNSDFSGCNWESYSSTKSFVLPSGNGVKTVYVKYKDNGGNVSDVYSDIILLLVPASTAPSSVRHTTTTTTNDNSNNDVVAESTLAFKVLDQSGNPVIGALVSLGTGNSGYTNDSGIVTFSNVTTGNQKVTVSYKSHKIESSAEVLGTETSDSPKIITMNFDSSAPANEVVADTVTDTKTKPNTLYIIFGILAVVFVSGTGIVMYKRRNK